MCQNFKFKRLSEFILFKISLNILKINYKKLKKPKLQMCIPS